MDILLGSEWRTPFQLMGKAPLCDARDVVPLMSPKLILKKCGESKGKQMLDKLLDATKIGLSAETYKIATVHHSVK